MRWVWSPAGAPATWILEVMDERQADLIVFGTRRTDDSDERLPGSTADPVISNASCPCAFRTCDFR